MHIDEKENVERIPEVNLLGLTRKIIIRLERWIRWIGEILLICAVFLARKFLWLIGFILIGVIAAFLNNSLSDKYYTSEFIIQCNIDVISDVIPLVNDLGEYCREKNLARLDEVLALEKATVESIRDIEAFWIIDVNGDEIPDYVDYLNKHDVRDTLNPRITDRFCVKVKSYNQEDFAAIRDGIIRMISSDEYVLKTNKARIVSISEDLDVIADQIVKLDSLENVMYFQNTSRTIPAGSQIVFLEEQETELFHGHILGLYHQKQDLQNDLDLFSDPFTLIRDLTYPISEENDLMFYLKMWVLVSLLAGLFVLIVIHNRHRLNTIYRRHL